MPKISINSLQDADVGPPPAGFVGGSKTWAYFAGDADPLHMHVCRIEAGVRLDIGPLATDRAGYVWEGEITAGGRRLDKGSSFVVEHGATLAITGGPAASMVAIFAATPASHRAGGHVHLLPSERVPRVGGNEFTEVSGGLHSDSTCATCELWLHENALPAGPVAPPKSPQDGVHSHAEDEIIFITEGVMRLGRRRLRKGAALAIAAHTFYGFSRGAEGLSFVTFRPSRDKGQIFKSGDSRAAAGYWSRVGSPQYLEPVSA